MVSLPGIESQKPPSPDLPSPASQGSQDVRFIIRDKSVCDTLDHLNTEYQRALAESSYDTASFELRQLRLSARHFETRLAYERRMKDIKAKHPAEQELDSYVELTLSRQVAPLDVEVGGMSLRQCADAQGETTPSQVYAFMVELYAGDGSPDTRHARSYVERLGTWGIIGSGEINKIRGKNGGKNSKGVPLKDEADRLRRAAEAAHTFAVTQNVMRLSILQEGEDAEARRAQISAYLDHEDQGVRNIATRMLGLHQIKDVVPFYRTLEELRATVDLAPDHTELIGKVLRECDVMVPAVLPNGVIMNADTLTSYLPPSTIDEGANNAEEQVSLIDDVAYLAQDTKYREVTDFLFDDRHVRSVDLQYDGDRLKATLHFPVGETDEPRSVLAVFDMASGDFDWSLIAGADYNPALKHAVLSAARSALFAVNVATNAAPEESASVSVVRQPEQRPLRRRMSPEEIATRSSEVRELPVRGMHAGGRLFEIVTGQLSNNQRATVEQALRRLGKRRDMSVIQMRSNGQIVSKVGDVTLFFVVQDGELVLDAANAPARRVGQ